MSFSAQFPKFAIASLVAAILVGCGDKENVATSSPAKQEAPVAPVQKEEVKNPYTAKFDAVVNEDRSQYLAVGENINIVRVYMNHRAWEEPIEDVAQGLMFGGFTRQDGKPKQFKAWEGLDDGLQQANFEYHDAKDAFDKRDAAVKFVDMLIADSKKIGDGRLVKYTDDASRLGLQPYNFENKSFVIGACIFSDKLEVTKEDKYAMRAGGGMPCIKGYLRNQLASNYSMGFKEAGWLRKLVVEDEQAARAIERMRLNGKIVVYGYVSEITRKTLGNTGKLMKDREIEIVPTMIDFMDGDTVVYTARKG